ncbi:hypothetical protein GGS23DRAFT_484643 [Durotheca rogersii]|uniref:uncharacterized protein n=1 Tax=Durotheca rogersii TaxID=419775 RepID=UPI00221F6700|nr:uncharacterized protein GGS23DRAFT_484643 [Durotheca rogersii]KAI5864147.1 hypothetical protein GGS23DRAFT_484643 [Durotheca rogersii]
MPYPDSSSAAGDYSDSESFTEQLSPTDGYFRSSNAVPLVPNVLVRDPTLRPIDQSGSEPKARETEGGGASSSPPSLLSNTQLRAGEGYRDSDGRPPRSNHPRERIQSEQAAISTLPRESQHGPTFSHTHTQSSSSWGVPLRSYLTPRRTPSVYSDAPPAYSPSPTTPVLLGHTTSQERTQSRSYNTFTSAMGAAEAENERLLGATACPASMSQPPRHYEVRRGYGFASLLRLLPPPLRQQRARRVRGQLPTWRKLLLVVLLVSIILAIPLRIIALSSRTSGEDDNGVSKPLKNI